MATSPFPIPYHAAATYHHPFPVGFSTAYTPASTVSPPPPPAPTQTPSTGGHYYPTPSLYASTSYPAPPAPGFFPAPAYGSSTFTPPPPLFSSATPAFPYAAAYPYPPPAPAYASPTGFYPAQPYGPSVPYATTSSCPTSEATPILTNVEPNWPSPAPDPTPPTSSTTSGYSTEAAATLHEVQRELLNIQARLRSAMLKSRVSQCQVSTGKRSTSTSRMQRDHAPMPLTDHAQVLKLRDSEVNADQSHASSKSPDPPTTPSSPSANLSSSKVDQVRTFLAFDGSTHHFLLEPSPALDMEKSKTSAEAQVRAEASISKNMPRAVLDLKRRLDEQQARDRTSFDTIKGELAQLTSMAAHLADSIGKQSSAAASSSVNSFHSHSDAAANAYVAPEVFDKIPTPNAGYENCFAHPNQRSCAHGERTNLREQNLDYSLEQTAPATVIAVYDDKSDACSNEFIPMFTDTPEQVTDEEEKSKSQCFSRPTFSHETPTVCVVGVLSLTNQLNPDYELCGKHVKPQVSYQPWNMLMTEAERKEWDPGTLKTIMFTSTSELLGKSFHKASANPSSEQLNCFSKPQDDQRACSDPVWKASDSLAPRCSQLSIDQSMRDLQLQWDPGDTKFHILFRTAAGATRLRCTNIYKFELVHILSVQFGAKREPNFESAIMCSYAFGFGWTEVNIAAIFALVIPCFKGRSVAKHSMFLSDGTSMTIPYSPNLLLHLLCAATTVLGTEQRHALEFSLMVEILPNESEFRDGLLAYISQAKYPCSLYSNSLVHQSKTKNLLSSPHYLQIKKMDIIFRTFRPP